MSILEYIFVVHLLQLPVIRAYYVHSPLSVPPWYLWCVADS